MPTLSNTSTKLSNQKCNQCGCDLIETTKKTERLGNSFSPMTTTTYRCSNQACQDEIDRKVNKNRELRGEREQARLLRMQATAAVKVVAE